MVRKNVWMVAGLVSLLVPTALISAQSVRPEVRSGSIDAVITYHRPPPTFGAPAEETWYKRGEDVRIEQRPMDGRDLLIQQFTHPGQNVSFTITRSADGRWQSLSLMDDPLASLPPVTARVFTGATEKHLGETCRIWQVNHRTEYDADFLQSGCVTSKGIELWWRQADIGAIFATSITYKPIPSREVRAPIEALDIAAWRPLTAGSDHRGDYQVDLRAPTPSGREILQTQSGPWKSTITREISGESSFSLINKAARIRMSFSNDRKGKRYLIIARQATVSSGISSPKNRVRLASMADGVILGTGCQWWDTMPNVSDATRAECLTSDGIPLAIVTSSWGSGSSITAKQFQRSPQPISAVAPDKQIKSASFWGF